MSHTDHYSQTITIQAHQAIPGKDFTHPAYIPFDRRILNYMLERLLHLIIPKSFEQHHLGQVLEQNESDGRYHRFLVLNRRAILAGTPLSLVGFFGHKRPQADSAPLVQMDRTLVNELQTHSGIFGYSTMELTCGNYANCVIVRDETAKLHWAKSINHQQTAQVDAPSFYYSVRIYNGRLPQGLARPLTISLDVVKYYYYETTPVWQAVRHLG